jgi:hypothetical protein
VRLELTESFEDVLTDSADSDDVGRFDVLGIGSGTD